MIKIGDPRKLRLISLALINFLLLVVIVVSLVSKTNLVRFHHHMVGEAEPSKNNGMDSINEDFTVKENFNSHLPIIVIDVDERNIKADTEWSDIKGYRVPINEDPFAYGKLEVINNKSRINKITDVPMYGLDLKIKLRGNSSLTFDKKQYMLKTTYKEGNKREKNIIGFGEEWEWILNISMADKSLLRNYLCLNIGAEIMPNIPDVKFVEVLFEKPDGFEYRGVYLMMESIKRDKNRVNIQKYKAGKGGNSYLLRRDRFHEDEILLDTYGRRTGLAKNYLEMKYPKEITDIDLQSIEKEISDFERAIYSDDPKEFYNYKKYIDKESFIDYFIINEFFGNYDAGFQSMYYYKNKSARISMGPLWDFDRSMDNFNPIAAKLDSTAMHNAVWFKELLRDKDFVRDIITRYYELRETVLSEEFLMDYIDSTIRFLGKSQERDWNKWAYYYEEENILDERKRKVFNVTTSYDEEIAKMKGFIVGHGRWLDENISSLYQFSEFEEDTVNKEVIYVIGEVFLGSDVDRWSYSINGLIFIMIFLISVVLIQRE